MKCFEGLVKVHVTSTLPDTLDPLQFAYRPNRYSILKKKVFFMSIQVCIYAKNIWGIGNDADNCIDGTNILSAILS